MEFMQMRDFSEFCEQLHEMRLKFHKWDSCERTVALYYLMAGLPFANARFLQHAIERCIAAVNTPDAQILERNANDPAYISNLMNEKPQVALSMLLTHLPLLRPGNRETAECYLKTIRRVLNEFITPPYRIYNECVEIMSYVFVHPAFDKEEKKTFKHLLKQVLNKVSPENFVHSPVNESSDESVSPNPEPAFVCPEPPFVPNCRLNRRSNSLTTAGMTLPDLAVGSGKKSGSKKAAHAPDRNAWSSQENLNVPQQKPRSYSLSSETMLIAVPNMQGSSSETRLQELQVISNLPAMRSIVSWLKSLRLHKYSWVFNNLTYEQMLDLSDDTLQAIGITKGARHKLLLSIAKLKERSALLTELETEVMNGGDLNNALKKLKNVLQSPLMITNGEDLPSQFIKVMGKVCTQLLMLRQPSDDVLAHFIGLCERADNLDTFTDEQKRKLNMWVAQITRGHGAAHNTRQPTVASNPRVLPAHSHLNQLSASTLQTPYTQKSSSYPNMQPVPTVHHQRHSVGAVTLQNQLLQVPLISNLSKNDTSRSDTIKSTTLKSNTSQNNGNQFHVRFKEFSCKDFCCKDYEGKDYSSCKDYTSNDYNSSKDYSSKDYNISRDYSGNSKDYQSKDFDPKDFSCKPTSLGLNLAKPSRKLRVGKTEHTCSKGTKIVIDHLENLMPIDKKYVPDYSTDQNETKKLKNVDIESNLESLCLQMMEHALGP